MSSISLGISSTTNVVTLVLEPQNTLSINTAGSVTPTSLLDLSDVDASSITDTQVLVYDAATQTFIPGSGGGSDTNIGNTDQTLTGVRDVEMDGNNLTFSQGDVVRHTISPTVGATFFRGVTIDGDNSDGGKLILKEASDNGTSIFSLSAPASLASNVEFILPSTDGVEKQHLVTDGSGNLSFDYTESVYLAVYNNNGVTLSAGTPVYAKGVQGNDIIIGVADANDSSKMPAIGVLLEELADASSGEIITAGLFNKTISGLTGVSVGDTIYVSNAGTLTVTKPTASTDLIQNIGVVLQTSGTNIQKMKVSAIDRTNDIPNLASGTFFIGGATGQVSPYTLPIADGTANQFLKTDGAGAVTFTSITQATGNELENVVEDTTPQLGGDLDAQSNNITNLGNLNGTAASTIISGAASGATALQDVVDDTTPQLGGTLDSNGNEIRFRGTGHTNYVAIAPSTLEPGSNVTFYPPIADGTSGQVIQTNGSGRLSFVTRATEDYVDTAANTLTENTQTGTTYTTVLTDAGKMITCNNASAITVTIPPNSSVAYEAGTVLSFIQKGAGQVTLSAGAGVTLNNANGLKTASQYSVISCWKEDTDTWIVYGDTTA